MTRKGWYWPVMIIGLLVGSVVTNLVVAVIASRDPSFAIEKDYYKKALAWDDRMAQERRNAELGWSLAVTLDPITGPPARARVTVVVTDRAGAPIDAAHVVVEAFHNARASQVFTGTLASHAPGRYMVTMPFARPGVWELRVRIERGSDVFTGVVSRELPTT